MRKSDTARILKLAKQCGMSARKLLRAQGVFYVPRSLSNEWHEGQSWEQARFVFRCGTSAVVECCRVVLVREREIKAAIRASDAAAGCAGLAAFRLAQLVMHVGLRYLFVDAERGRKRRGGRKPKTEKEQIIAALPGIVKHNETRKAQVQEILRRWPNAYSERQLYRLLRKLLT